MSRLTYDKNYCLATSKKARWQEQTLFLSNNKIQFATFIFWKEEEKAKAFPLLSLFRIKKGPGAQLIQEIKNYGNKKQKMGKAVKNKREENQKNPQNQISEWTSQISFVKAHFLSLGKKQFC